MTHHTRFEPMQGPPDTAHRRYYGGRLVGLVLWLVDRWRGSAEAARPASALAADVVTRTTGTARAYWSTRRGAVAARFLYAELSRLSDGELARRGLSRDDINRLVLESSTARIHAPPLRGDKTETGNDRRGAASVPAERVRAL